MLVALACWFWAGVGPWVWWGWAIFAGAASHTLQACGLVWLGERLGKWWGGQ